MRDRQPNEGLTRLYRESRWTLRQLAQAVNKIGTERGTPTRYQPPSVHQWLDGHLPKEDVRPLILEALARHLRRPVTFTEAGFPRLLTPRRKSAPWKACWIWAGVTWTPRAGAWSGRLSSLSLLPFPDGRMSLGEWRLFRPGRSCG